LKEPLFVSAKIVTLVLVSLAIFKIFVKFFLGKVNSISYSSPLHPIRLSIFFKNLNPTFEVLEILSSSLKSPSLISRAEVINEEAL